MSIIRIQCPNPNCKMQVSVDYKPTMETKPATCPYCKRRTFFKDWIKLDVPLEAPPPEQKPNDEDEQRRHREQEELRQREEQERILREEQERIQREREAQRQREEQERIQREREAQRQREEQERIQREREAQRQREEQERIQREREEQERRDRELWEKRQQQMQAQNAGIGRLVVLSTGVVHQLRPGVNVVGRMATTTTANIQIPDITGNNRMSREHLVINVVQEYGGFAHYATLYKPGVNMTYVRNMPLVYGQQVPLYSGDLIMFPNETVRFEIVSQNSDETAFVY